MFREEQSYGAHALTSSGLWLRLTLSMAKFRHLEKEFRHTKDVRNGIRN